jgi:NADH dehydrogenase
MAWAFIHVYLLVGFQHRVLVSIQWLWRYLTYEHGARLIAEEEPSLRHRGNTEHLREPR